MLLNKSKWSVTQRFYWRGDFFMNYSEIIKFHGHSCPGLAIGYRMARAGIEALDSIRAADEEVVAIVENDACGVDALQCLTGCTFGKGNLLFRDYGKHVYTLYARERKKGVRIVFHGQGIPDEIREDREEFIKWLLNAEENEILSITPVSIKEPEPAEIRKSILCASCGESVMESRTRNLPEKGVCIPCFEEASQGEMQAAESCS